MKEKITNVIGVAIFYIVLVLMVFIVNMRYTYLNQNNLNPESSLAFND